MAVQKHVSHFILTMISIQSRHFFACFTQCQFRKLCAGIIRFLYFSTAFFEKRILPCLMRNIAQLNYNKNIYSTFVVSKCMNRASSARNYHACNVVSFMATKNFGYSIKKRKKVVLLANFIFAPE